MACIPLPLLAQTMHRMPQATSGGVRHLCPPHVVVIMAQYTDVKFSTNSTSSSFSEFFNATNYTFEGATGSVQQYFKDQSYGQYVPVFDVVGPVTLSNNQKYYGSNDDYNNDLAADEMVAEACNLAEDLADFSLYDSDGDGQLDAVVVLFAGCGEVYGVSDEDAVWPYSGDLETSEEIDYSVKLDGKTVSFFCAVPELETGTRRAGIGTFVHEFAHILGLPNLCVTDGGLQKTLGDWDVMDHGSYNNNSRTPAGMSAYEKFYLGWVEPILLDAPMNVRLRDFATTGDCAIITASGQSNLNGLSPDPREFYILENRQQIGWDKYLPGHGLMLTKIDYVKNKWEADEVNNVERHPCVDLIEADGSAPKYKADNLTNGYFGKPKDLFPAGATEYSMFSNKMYFSSVTEQGEVITFDFLGGVDKCEVAFYVGAGGSCSTTSITETKKGAGVTLPAVTAQSGFTFLGWSTRKNSNIPDAGQPGEKYYPMSNCTLYAVMQDNTRVWFYYDIKGVTIGDYIDFNGAYLKTNELRDIAVTFGQKNGYAVPTADQCKVQVVSGGKQLPNAVRFETDSIRIAISAADITGDVYITIINVREQTEEGCVDYSHTFTQKCYAGSAQDLNGYDWTVTIANDNTTDYDKSKGAVFGSGTYPARLVKLYTEETMGCGVAEVRVTASANGDGILSVYVAGNEIGYEELTSTSETYIFPVEQPVSGAVEIRLTNTNKAMYIKQIEIYFEKINDPDIISGVEAQSVGQMQGKSRKILHEGRLYILFNGHMYNILGTKIK